MTNWTIFKLITFLHQKKLLRKSKDNPFMVWEIMFVTYICDKGRIPEYEKLLQFKEKKTDKIKIGKSLEQILHKIIN